MVRRHTSRHPAAGHQHNGYCAYQYDTLCLLALHPYRSFCRGQGHQPTSCRWQPPNIFHRPPLLAATARLMQMRLLQAHVAAPSASQGVGQCIHCTGRIRHPAHATSAQANHTAAVGAIWLVPTLLHSRLSPGGGGTMAEQGFPEQPLWVALHVPQCPHPLTPHRGAQCMHVVPGLHCMRAAHRQRSIKWLFTTQTPHTHAHAWAG